MPVTSEGNDLYMHLTFTEFGSKPFSVTLKRKFLTIKMGSGHENLLILEIKQVAWLDPRSEQRSAMIFHDS